MANIRFRRENLIPSKTIVTEAFYISLSVAVVLFIANLFGIDLILKFVPEALRLFVLVALGVYLRGLFDLKILGKEVL